MHFEWRVSGQQATRAATGPASAPFVPYGGRIGWGAKPHFSPLHSSSGRRRTASDPHHLCTPKMPHPTRALILAIGLALACCWLASTPATAEAVHALAMHGSPKHGPGFTHFSYVNP